MIILLALLSFSTKMTVPPRASRMVWLTLKSFGSS
jgi:hypothetical protein